MSTLSDGKKTISIFAESEEENIENVVAQYPIQSGNLVTDHTHQSAIVWTIDGKIYGKNHTEINSIWKQLMDWEYAGTQLTWRGAVTRHSVALTNITKTYDDGGFRNAVKVSIEFKEIRLVSTSFVKVKHVGPVKPASPPKPPGVYVTVRPGNTYWGWWRQYGTPIQTLRNWNHWPDRRIPVGARARVK